MALPRQRLGSKSHSIRLILGQRKYSRYRPKTLPAKVATPTYSAPGLRGSSGGRMFRTLFSTLLSIATHFETDW